MKKRILSLVLCAALLLSLCLFMGAGVVGDAAADMTETAGTVEDTQSSPGGGADSSARGDAVADVSLPRRARAVACRYR